MTVVKKALLGDVVKIIGGGTPSRAKPEYYNGSIRWITVKDFGDEIFLQKSQETITEQGLKESATNLIPAGNVILVTRMAVGKVAINLVDVAINQDLKALICKHNLYYKYLLFFLLSCSNHLNLQADGATVKGITIDEVEELEIPLPPLVEQKRIAAILEKCDRLRRTRRYTLQLSDTFLQSVFLEMFGDPVTNPMGWEITQLGNLLEFPPQNGLYVPKDNYENAKYLNGIEMVHMSDLFYGIVSPGNLKRVNICQADIEKYSIDENDLLVARRSLVYEGAAKPCRVPKPKEPLVFESSIIRIRVNNLKLLPVYLYYYLSNERARLAHVLKYVTESTISGINQSGLNSVEVIKPPLPLQEKFAQIVQKYERLRTQERESDRQAEHLFQTLLHRAFRGELTNKMGDTGFEPVTPSV